MSDNRRMFLFLACLAWVPITAAQQHYELQRRFAHAPPYRAAMMGISPPPTLVSGLPDLVCVSAQPSTGSKLPTGHQEAVVCGKHVPSRGELFSGNFAWIANQRWKRVAVAGRMFTRHHWTVPVYRIVEPDDQDQ